VALRQLFGYEEQPNFPPRHNIAPTQPIPVLILDNGKRHFRLMRWGLVPAWVKDPHNFTLLINARSETLREKPAFKNAIKRRRVLIPADGYYEWQTTDGRKRAFFIHRRDGAPLGFAALAETWSGPNGEEVDTVAIVTAPASKDLATLHHRVPVTIRPADFEAWLDCSLHDVGEVMVLLRPPEEGEFTWHEVSTRVNSVANDDAQLILPITEEQRAAEEEAKKPVRKAVPRKPPAPIDDGQGSLF
jgi:putative SOS response-associated peptidase YedK